MRMKNLKRNKRAKLPEGFQICDKCLNGYAPEEIHLCDCGELLCDFCIKIHEHENC